MLTVYRLPAIKAVWQHEYDQGCDPSPIPFCYGSAPPRSPLWIADRVEARFFNMDAM